MDAAKFDNRLRGSDAALLALGCLLFFGISLVQERNLTIHESVHCQNVREMIEGGDWAMATYGGRPWLERPPLPHWATAVFVMATGQPGQAWSYRLGSIAAACLIVVMAAWGASLCFGRRIGLLSGFVLATICEFVMYAVAPECDIFLCAIVTSALVLFLHAEFGNPSREPRFTFFGLRTWHVFAFFVLAALANVAKGLFFGDLLIFVPIAAYFAWTRDGSRMKQYVWAWGWLAFGLIAPIWAIAVYSRYPDVVDLWLSDYVGRVNTDYIREPFWYYPVNLPQILFPWTLASFIGIAVVLEKARRQAGPERFLLVWAIAPVVVLSLFRGKHHHYLLPAMASWAILGAFGIVRIGEWIGRTVPAWTRNPRLATSLLVGAVVLGHWSFYVIKSRVGDRYVDDRAFIEHARALVPVDQRPLVLNDTGPLTSSWLMFYLDRPSTLLHNESFLHSDQIDRPVTYVVTRANQIDLLRNYGTPEELCRSSKTRGEQSPGDRWTLFRLRLRDDLPRYPANVRFTPMQGTGRASGPVLGAL